MCSMSRSIYPAILPCSIFSNSGHVGWCTSSPDTILKLDTLVMIQTKFGFNWSSSFRGEDFWKSLWHTTDAKWWQNLTWPFVILGIFLPREKSWPPWYNWNIVESDAKYHKPKSFGNWANEKVLLYPAAMWNERKIR